MSFSYTIKCNRSEFILGKVFCQLHNIPFETNSELGYLGIYIIKLSSVGDYTTVNDYVQTIEEDEE